MDGSDNPTAPKAKVKRRGSWAAAKVFGSTETEATPRNVRARKSLVSEHRRNDEVSSDDFEIVRQYSPSQLPTDFSVSWKQATESSRGQMQQPTFAFHAPPPPPPPPPTDVPHESRINTPSPQRASGGEERDDDGDIFDSETGAPKISDILTTYDTHVARWIWMGDPTHEEKILNVYRRDKWMVRLKKEFNDAQGQEWANLVEQTRLTSMFQVQLDKVDHTLISAFVERWHPETNTFHFPWGEMTVTLHDVRLICGLPIDGDAVIEGMTDAEVRMRMHNTFGWDMATIDKYHSNGGVVMTDLRACRTDMMKRGMKAHDIASAYLLELLGVTIFLDKSTNKVSGHLASLVFDHTRTGKLAWGVGALAYLYRALGESSRADVATMCGLSALLQHWIWLYFPFFHGHSMPDSTGKNQPVASQHVVDRTRFRDPETLKAYRRMLDVLPPEQVNWVPYRSWDIDWEGDLLVSSYRGTIRCFSVHEAYHPDRVLRQFGRVQCVPMTRIIPVREDRPRKAAGYVVVYNADDDHWNERQNNLCSMLLKAPKANGPWDMDDDYHRWYVPRCHPYVLKTSFKDAPKLGRPPMPVDITRRFQMMMSMVRGICSEERGASYDEMQQLMAIGDSIES